MWHLGYCATDFNGHIVHVHGGGMHDAVPILCGGYGFCCLSNGSAMHKRKAFALHDTTCSSTKMIFFTDVGDQTLWCCCSNCGHDSQFI